MPSRIYYDSTGRLVDPFHLTPEDVSLDDLAMRLPRIHRWAASVPYTVAEHWIAAAVFCTLGKPAIRTIARWAFLHDAAEAWLGDVPSPMKRDLAWSECSYVEVENRILGVVAERFNLGPPPIEMLDAVDGTLRTVERCLFFSTITVEERERLGQVIDPYGLRRTGREPTSQDIRDVFMGVANSLGIE